MVEQRNEKPKSLLFSVLSRFLRPCIPFQNNDLATFWLRTVFRDLAPFCAKNFKRYQIAVSDFTSDGISVAKNLATKFGNKATLHAKGLIWGATWEE
jgi:hypothetical protein